MKHQTNNLEYEAPCVMCIVLSPASSILKGSGKPGTEIIISDDEW